MIMIDTEYQSLTEIDPEIVRFYAEDTRQRVIGWDEDKEEPIKESYTVIVLVKPYFVGYGDVEHRRMERKPWEIVKEELERAITWEDFEINHDKYLLWKDDFATWETEQPHEDVWDEDSGEFIPKLVDAPERPQIDESKRVGHYEKITTQYDSNLWDFHGEFSEQIDHEARTITKDPVLTAKPDHVVAAYHRELAKATRENIKNSNIFVHGNYFQVAKTDRDNMTETTAFAARNGIADQTTDWITASNEVVTLTYHQIEAIKDAYVLRMADLFKQYNEWCSTGMLTPFYFVEPSYE
ncbi:DUF4376 domain-containing protein [Vibrio harveyi]|uniref:DUF4376 domain-containing protein n=1 Tax=Vibrio harveyi TaxID=669 RepID=UPI0025B13B56|nr:DUF4376 domain-containing protein [Vibrio harveyi]WJT09285.1 DUF4376 domain-containing protein [Vibrio harveyi]